MEVENILERREERIWFLIFQIRNTRVFEFISPNEERQEKSLVE